MGSDKPIVAGGRPPGVQPPTKRARFHEVQDQPLGDVYKIIFFSPEEVTILSTKESHRVLFATDYGTGKVSPKNLSFLKTLFLRQ